jgi:hypothetical protein
MRGSASARPNTAGLALVAPMVGVKKRGLPTTSACLSPRVSVADPINEEHKRAPKGRGGRACMLPSTSRVSDGEQPLTELYVHPAGQPACTGTLLSTYTKREGGRVGCVVDCICLTEKGGWDGPDCTLPFSSTLSLPHSHRPSSCQHPHPPCFRPAQGNEMRCRR